MGAFHKFVCLSQLSIVASLKSDIVRNADSNGIPVLRRTRALTNTNVVSHAFCDSSLPAEEKMGKKTMEEVHTYAELKHDPRASLLIPSPFAPQS